MHHVYKSVKSVLMCVRVSERMHVCECPAPAVRICACTGCCVMVYALTYHAPQHTVDPEHGAPCVHVQQRQGS